MFSANSSQVSEDRLYVEDVFSTYLYTGNGSLRNITNGIDLATKGGMVWIKSRSGGSLAHVLYDTARGPSYQLVSNANSAEYYDSTGLNNFNSDGFQIWNLANVNSSGGSYTSWTFRKAPKFFDVVTYTGNGSTARAISHSLGVAPGSMIIKRTDSTGQWVVYHRSLGNAKALILESTIAQVNTNTFGYTTPDATTFTVGDYNNINGATYVAYLFAHDTTSDGIIQCGSYTTTGSDQEVNLGWEPQWVLIKNTDLSGNAYTGWGIFDTMRGFTVDLDTPLLANSSSAENGTYNVNTYNYVDPTPTGFKVKSGTTLAGAGTAGYNYIYIAIRRGPMRTPTSGTSVFAPVAISSPPSARVTTNFPVDLSVNSARSPVAGAWWFDRLRGFKNYMGSFQTSADATDTVGLGTNIDNTGYNNSWQGTDPAVFWNFRRAPSFFDEVCYTGTGSARTVNHNLGVAPELMIVKPRNTTGDWFCYNQTVGAAKTLFLNGTNAATNYTVWNSTAPTSAVFSLSGDQEVNWSGYNFVAYLFASCPGVSKCGTYTGNGSSQTINCGFAAGARFVMIKRTDSTGSWWVWDVARGLVSGNDPALQLNSTAAETTGIDSIDPDSSGFIVNQDATTNINVSSGQYIYLAVA